MSCKLISDSAAFVDMPVVDTSIDVEIHNITDMQKLRTHLIKLYGDIDVTADGRVVKISKLKNEQTVSIAPQPHFCKLRYGAADVLRVTERLTLDDGGCPWDKAQTHESIRINMIEEAYEAVDAIDKRDVANMREEFGDVLLQSVLQSDISRRKGEFDFGDVCDELCKKLIGRHTFIFGGDTANTADDALGLWEKAKATEKNYDGVKTQLTKMPDSFPSLLLCQKTYKKLKKAGLTIDAKAALDSAYANNDYAEMISACVALLSDSGKDAETELNTLVKRKISKL